MKLKLRTANIILFYWGIVCALFFGGTAFAESADSEETLASSVYQSELDFDNGNAPVYNWTGFYLGLDAGYSLAPSQKIRETYGPGADKEPYMNSLSGFVGDLYAGYNFSLPAHLVFSLEMSLLFTQLQLKQEVVLSPNQLVSNTPDTKELMITPMEYGENIGIIPAVGSLRLGYDMGKFLPYLGISRTYRPILVTKLAENAAGQMVPVDKAIQLGSGTSISVGVDYGFKEHIVLRAEYRSNFYGQRRYNEKAGSYLYLPQEVRLGIAYKF